MAVEFNSNLRGDLAARLRPINDFYAQLVTAPETTFTPVPAEFLHRAYIVLAQKFSPTRPIQLYIGCGAGGEAYVLNGQPDEFARMTAGDGVTVTSGEQAIQVARTFLVVTRPQNRRYQVITSAAELPWRPNLEPAETARRDESQRALADVIKAPVASARSDGGFDVSLFIVQQMNVEQLTVTVSHGGQVTTTSRVAAADLPFTYTM